MVEIKELSKAYGDKVVIDLFSYSFKSGLYVIMGKSGCGKTTLLNLISFKDNKYQGSIKRDSEIFYITIDDLIDSFTVKEQIDLFKDMFESYKDKKEKFGLEELYNKKVDKLSFGEKQRLCVYLSLCSGLETILLDEPLAYLDEVNKKKVVKEIEKESKKRLLIVVSHDLADFKKPKVIKLDAYKKHNVDNFIEDSYIKNSRMISSCKWGSLLIKKSFIHLLLFIVVISSFLFMTKSLTDEFSYINDEVFSSFENGNLYYKENDVLLDNDTFYNEVILSLVNEIESYGSSIYSSEMYNHKVYLDKYYFDNGFIFSNVYVGNNIKENEVVVSVNLDEFCLNNDIIYCLKDEIKTNLVGKKFIYKGKEEHVYKIKEVIEGNNSIYVNNLDFINELFKREFNEYYSYYYIGVNDDNMEKFYQKLNEVDMLLKYDFHLYYEDENCRYFLVSASKHKYFSYSELKNNNLVACNSIISCDSFNFTKLKSLKYINDIDMKNNVSFVSVNENLNPNEVIVSSSLLELLNVKRGDLIKLKFNINDSVYVSEMVIRDVIEESDYVLYQNSTYTYDLIFRVSGETERIEYTYGDSNDYLSTELFYSDILSDTISFFEVFMNVLNISFILFEGIIIAILFYIEYRRGKKYLKFYKLLEYGGVDNCFKIFFIYSLIYLFVAILLLLLDYMIAILYMIIFLVFYIKYKSKIKT